MTTATQVKKLIQPLLDQNPDLAWVGRQIYLKPVHHFARTILIDRIFDPDGFRPQWAVVHLFELNKDFILSWGEWLRKTSGLAPNSWSIRDQNVGGKLIDAIELNALPRLRAMNSLDDYLSYVAEHHVGGLLYGNPARKIIVDVACGDLKEARSICHSQRALWAVDEPHYDDEDKSMLKRLRELCKLLMLDDERGLVNLLHTWEAETVKNLKIEHLWAPTPFPLEQ